MSKTLEEINFIQCPHCKQTIIPDFSKSTTTPNWSTEGFGGDCTELGINATYPNKDCKKLIFSMTVPWPERVNEGW